MIGGLLRAIARLVGRRSKSYDLNFSIVMLSSDLPELSDTEVVDAVRRALPTSAPAMLEASPLQPPEESKGLENPGRMIPVTVNRCVYGIIIARFPYEPAPEGSTTSTGNPELDAAYRSHKGWIAVDHLAGETDQAYAVIGQLAAELAPPSSCLFFLPGLSLAAIPSPDLLEAMRTGSWLDHMSTTGRPAIMQRPADDAALAQAAADARARFPEFAHAFATNHGINHSAKFPFSDGQSVEHMWIEVESITTTTITGTLGNEPHEIKGFAMGDRVTLPIEDLEDWLYVLNNDIVGGFSIQALIDEHES